MGSTRMGPPTTLIEMLQQRLGLDHFVETGTFQGHTAAWAADRFARVTTIELSPQYHAAAVARFRSQPQVRPLQGSSADVLARVVAELQGPAVFWLDAHWSGLDTAGREAECPLLAELAVLNAAEGAHVILVDDARLFLAPPPRPHRAEQWPNVAAAVAALTDSGRRYVAVFDDVLIAVPVAARAATIAWLQDAATAERAAAHLPWWRKLWP